MYGQAIILNYLSWFYGWECECSGIKELHLALDMFVGKLCIYTMSEVKKMLEITP